jgi:hypothetical protein
MAQRRPRWETGSSAAFKGVGSVSSASTCSRSVARARCCSVATSRIARTRGLLERRPTPGVAGNTPSRPSSGPRSTGRSGTAPLAACCRIDSTGRMASTQEGNAAGAIDSSSAAAGGKRSGDVLVGGTAPDIQSGARIDANTASTSTSEDWAGGAPTPGGIGLTSEVGEPVGGTAAVGADASPTRSAADAFRAGEPARSSGTSCSQSGTSACGRIDVSASP